MEFGMKLQLAIDRVTLEDAINILEDTQEFIDIAEIGTSLIKDYGMESIRIIRNKFPKLKLLADMKTIDEAEYEFKAVYEAGADISTVMGAAAFSTIELCSQTAAKYNKEYMIDLLEVEDVKIDLLKKFNVGIFCIHLATDDGKISLTELVKSKVVKLEGISRIAVAGGVNLDLIPMLKNQRIQIAVVGSAITKATNRREVVRAFYQACKK